MRKWQTCLSLCEYLRDIAVPGVVQTAKPILGLSQSTFCDHLQRGEVNGFVAPLCVKGRASAQAVAGDLEHVASKIAQRARLPRRV